MNDAKTELGRKILRHKAARGLKWADIAARIGMSPAWTCALCMGQMSAEPRHAAGIAELLGLDEEDQAVLCEIPYRGAQPMPPTAFASRKCGQGMRLAPASRAASVRSTATKRPKITTLPPCRANSRRPAASRSGVSRT